MIGALIETIREQERELVELKALTREAETLRQENLGERHRQAAKRQQPHEAALQGSPQVGEPPPRAARKRGSSCRVADAAATGHAAGRSSAT